MIHWPPLPATQTDKHAITHQTTPIIPPSTYITLVHSVVGTLARVTFVPVPLWTEPICSAAGDLCSRLDLHSRTSLKSTKTIKAVESNTFISSARASGHRHPRPHSSLVLSFSDPRKGRREKTQARTPKYELSIRRPSPLPHQPPPTQRRQASFLGQLVVT